MFIDTHAHIYSQEFENDLDFMIKSASQVGVEDIFMPNIDTLSIERMLHLSKTYEHCHAMMGLHPCSVKEDYLDVLAVMENQIKNDQIKAIGEIGIDLYWDKTFGKQQELAFQKQISWAKDLQLPIVIHSRESLDLTIEIVSEMQDGSLGGIFHCFNGTKLQAQMIIDLGFYMGIGGVITYKNAGVDKVVSEISLSHLVLETDAPYLSPVPYRGKRNECKYIFEIATKLAEIKGVSIDEVGLITTQNAKKIFKCI
jgi:TatD DNase family protein